MPFIQLKNTKKIRLRVSGQTYPELFQECIFGLFDTIDPRRKYPSIKNQPTRIVTASGLDYEDLLLEWLKQFINLHNEFSENYHHLTITDFSETQIEATTKGLPIKKEQLKIKTIIDDRIEIKKTANGLETIITFE